MLSNHYSRKENTAVIEYKLENFMNYCDDMIATEAMHIITGDGCLLKPVFIVLLYSDTTFDHIAEKFVKNQNYWHAAIGFGPALSTCYSFNFDECDANKIKGGLSFESMDFYKREAPTGDVYVSCIFLSKEKYKLIQDKLNWFIKNKNKTRYAFVNLVYSLVGKKKESKSGLNLVCSTFVDALLKSADVDITHKPNNLVKPDDLMGNKYTKQIEVFRGKTKDYDAMKAAALVEREAEKAENDFHRKEPKKKEENK